MPRSPRIEFDHAIYHVTSRGNAKKALFFTDADRQRFIQQLQDNVDNYGVILYAWVLMPNHFHLVLRTPRGNLSRFMQRLNSSYCLYFRYKHDAPGHVLGGRYKARLIESEDYLLTATRYVHLNPVNVAKQQELSVKSRINYLEAYPWSSYPAYVNSRLRTDWLSERVLQLYGNTLQAARRRYRTYMRAAIMKTDEASVRLMNSNAYAVGSASFVARTKELLAERVTGEPTDADVELPHLKITLEEIDRLVCDSYGIEIEHLRKHGLMVGTAKTMAIELAIRHSGETMRAIGQHYGGISGQAVAMTRQRFRKLDGGEWALLERRLKRNYKGKK